MRAECLAVVLSTDDHARETPLLEAALLSVGSSSRGIGAGLQGRMEGQVLANVYTNMRQGWEPLLEPWPFAVQAKTATPRCEHVFCTGCAMV